MIFVNVETDELIKKTATLAADIWRRHYVPIVGSEQVEYMLDKFQSEQAIKNQIDSGYIYCLLCHKEQTVGYFAVEKQPEHSTLFISKYYISEDFRGRGFGRSCMGFIEDLCREFGLSKLSLTVNKHNTASIVVYERLGFENTGSTIADIGGGFVMDDYKMVKAIL